MLLFALCCLDIGFLIISLSKYNHQWNEAHFEVVTQVLNYLIKIKDKGIIYNHTKLIPAFLAITDLYLPESRKELFLVITSTLQLTSTVDTSFAPELGQRKSITRYAFFLAKAAVYYKCKL